MKNTIEKGVFARGGAVLSKENALLSAMKMGVDFDKDFHAQSYGNELAELAKKVRYRKSKTSSGSLGRAFFEHLQKIYDKNPSKYKDLVKSFSEGGDVKGGNYYTIYQDEEGSVKTEFDNYEDALADFKEFERDDANISLWQVVDGKNIFLKQHNSSADIEYVELSNGDIVVTLEKQDGKWYEGDVLEGEKPYGWGGKTYMGYLKPKDLAQWLGKDYGGYFEIVDQYAKGGGIGFKGLSDKVAKRYEGKKVAPKYQGEYGKRYSKSEAKEVGNKVAGKVYAQQQGRKMAEGGEILQEISTHKAIKKGDKIYIYLKGLTIKNKDDREFAKEFPDLFKDELLRVIPAENEDDLFYIFENYEETNRYNLSGYARGGNVNTGRAWKLDRARHNKSEPYEKPMSKRKRKYEDGGQIGQEIVFDDSGEENTGVIKDITNLGDYVVKADDGRTLLAQRELDVISLGAMRSASTEAPRKRFGFFEDGGQIGQEIVFDDNGDENTGVIKDITNAGDYIVSSDDGRTLLAQRQLDVISLGAMRSSPIEAPRKRFGFFEEGGSVSGNRNKRFLDSLDVSYKQRVLRNIANHYGISIVEAEEEVTDSESENLYEYITDSTLRMQVYNDMKNRRYDNGGGVDEVITINIQGYPYYLKKMGDTTHFKLANSKEGIDYVIGSHIGQHKGEEYYSDVASWLKGGKSPNGKSYNSFYYAQGGGVSGLDDLIRG
jgi:hypothetical protein